jgi:hypothetical protein
MDYSLIVLCEGFHLLTLISVYFCAIVDVLRSPFALISNNSSMSASGYAHRFVVGLCNVSHKYHGYSSIAKYFHTFTSHIAQSPAPQEGGGNLPAKGIAIDWHSSVECSTDQ